MDKFSNASGQSINLQKSRLIFSSDIPVNVRNSLATVLNIPIWDNVGSYLGVPAEWGRSEIHSLKWIKERVLSKMDGWKEKLLNQAGKEVVIKAVLQAIPSCTLLAYQNLFERISILWWQIYGGSLKVRKVVFIGRVVSFSLL